MIITLNEMLLLMCKMMYPQDLDQLAKMAKLLRRMS